MEVSMSKPDKYPTYEVAGQKVPSVTTIIGRFKDSGGLLYWANQCGLKGQTLAQAREPAATAGTMAHELVEAHLRGEPEPSLKGEKEITEKAHAAFSTFLKWQKQCSLEFRHVEVPLVSDQHRFGGRIDAIGVVGNELVLCDFKTSNSVYADYTFQMGAYKVLWEENYPEHPLIGGFHLLRFAKEEGDFAHHHFPKLDKEAAVFLSMRKLFDEVKECERRVK
jgi:hypothetical protein